MLPFYEQKKNEWAIFMSRDMTFLPHLHDHLELLYALDAGITVKAGTETRMLGKGDLAVVFPNTIHSYERAEVVKNQRSILVLCPLQETGEFLQMLSSRKPVSSFLRAEELHPDVGYGMRALVQEPKEERNLAACRGLIQLVLARALPMMQTTKVEAPQPLVQRVVRYMTENYQEHVTIDTLAKAVGVSRFTISHLFSERLQSGFPDYLNRLRISYAETLLRSSEMTVTEICYECGFDSHRTFIRAFQKQHALSPREYRKRYLEQSDVEERQGKSEK